MASYKNAVILAKIRDLCKIRKKILDKVCHQVIIVIQFSNLWIIHVRCPYEAEKEETKK